MGVSSINSLYTGLSSGYSINKAADNAAGLAIAEKLQIFLVYRQHSFFKKQNSQ